MPGPGHNRGGQDIAKLEHAVRTEDFDALGITVKRIRKQLFSPKISGVPEDLAMYRVRTRRGSPGADAEDVDDPGT